MRVIFLIMLGLSVSAWAGLSKNGNIVNDSRTALQWQDNITSPTLKWEPAITYCKDLTLDGYSDWRLPNIRELNSLIDDSRRNPAIEVGVFEHLASDFYWSSTSFMNTKDKAWNINFNSGRNYYDTKANNTLRVLCVRTGQ